MTPSFTTINRWARWLHIYSAAPLLLLMVFFAFTGVLLNHAEWRFGETKQSNLTLELPSTFSQFEWNNESTQTALAVLNWLDRDHNIHGVDIDISWELEEQLLILHLEGPEGSYSVEVYPADELAEVFTIDLPFLDTLNNLHRGKHVTGFWRWLSDLSGILMLLFCLSGLWLLIANRLQRQTTLSWVSLGAMVTIFSIYLMH